ncbi:cyclic nucleotide-binding domain-containing protein, partial [bacterium]|nr:cyclic nucleotide-binding domain-containing protein [bacterium]
GVDLLLGHLATHKPELRYEVLKALGKLRARYPGLFFDGKIVTREVAIEAARYLQLARLSPLLPGEGERAALLVRAIGETQQLRLESVFRLLGLLYPAKDLLNAYHGLMSGRRVMRANSQEFLDNLLTGSHRQLVRSLLDEQPVTEAWLASGVAGEVDLDVSVRSEAEALDFIGASCDPWLAACAIAAGGTPDNPAARCYLIPLGDEMLSTVEKVLLLQNVELFARIPTDQLAALGAIAREVSVMAGDTIYREHDHPDALYMVLQGAVQLHQGLRTISVAGPRETFGIWALFDPEPRVMTATAMEDSRLLRIERNEFNDLLADDVRIAQGIIRTVAGRLRSLAERVS